MEPQTDPTNSGNVVIGGSPQPDPQVPVNPGSENGGSKKKWLVLAIVVVVVLAVGGVLLATRGNGTTKQDQKQTQQQQKPVVTTPDYGNIKVGNFRYVNACKAFTSADEQNLFAGLAGSASISAEFAENTLPSSDFSITGNVPSSCSRQFGSDTAYAGTNVHFEIDQYATAQAAQKAYAIYQKAGTALAGASNTVYDASKNASYTLDSNKVILFTGLLQNVTPQKFQQSIVAVLPKVLANVHDDTLGQQMNQESTFGQKIGDATYVNPCSLFTDADYKTITGSPNDPSNILIDYNYGATTLFFTNVSSGLTNNGCTRYPYPGAKGGEGVLAQIDYFKTTASASQTVKQNFTSASSEADIKTQQISGLGDYAYYKQSGDLTSLDVQKGPYILKLNITIGDSDAAPSVASYTKAANVLLPKLP